MTGRRNRETPSISVLMPAYQHVRFLGEAVESVWRQQDIPLELIVVDDGSTDGTFELASALRERSPIPMTVVKQANGGTAAALRRAFQFARGTYVALLASDDRFAAGRFVSQLAAFTPDVQVVYGNGVAFSQAGPVSAIHGPAAVALLRRSAAEIRDHLYRSVDPCLYVQAALFRRSFLEAIGAFDAAGSLDDWPLNIRVFEALAAGAGRFAFVDEIVVEYRRHATNSDRDLPRHVARIERAARDCVPAHLRADMLAGMYLLFGRNALFRGQVATAIRMLSRGLRYRLQAGSME